jgi:hypothetical protein
MPWGDDVFPCRKGKQVTLSITGPMGNMIEARTSDLVSLAVRAGQLRSGGSALAPRPASQPAVTIDPRTKALADRIDEARQKTASAEPQEPTQAERLAGLETRRLVAEEIEAGVERFRKKISDVTEIVKRFDETGEMWETNPFGELVLSPPDRKFLMVGGHKEYIEILRERIPRMPAALQSQIESASAWRNHYEESRRNILEGR